MDMTKRQMLLELEHGTKITHKYFLTNEYIYTHDSGHLKDENDNIIPYLLFWQLRQSPKWDKNWGVWIENKNHKIKEL